MTGQEMMFKERQKEIRAPAYAAHISGGDAHMANTRTHPEHDG